ncbi:hypothetical protein D3C81_1846180 [compost metagenome]
MIDAFHLQEIECIADIGRRAFFAGVGDHTEAEFTTAGKDALEFFRRIASF